MAIRRAKRAEEKCEAFCEAAVKRSTEEAIRRAKRAEEKCGAFSEAASESCSGWRFGERSEPKENAKHLARLRQSGQFQEKKDRKE